MKYRHLCFLPLFSLLFAVGSLRAQETEAVNHYRTGYELLKNRNYRNAAIELEQAVAIDSTYGAAHYALAQAYKILNEYSNAIEAFETARSLGMSPDRIAKELSQLYHKSAVSLYQQRKYQDAISSFEKSLSFGPDNAKAYYAMGLCYNGLRQSKKARATFAKAIKADPQYAKPYKALGDIQLRNRDYGPATETYQQAIAIDSTYMDAYGGLAMVMIESGDLERTVELMQKAIKIDPKYANGYLFLGTALNELGRQHEAVDPLRRAVELDSQKPEAHLRLGEAYYGKGDYRNAVETGLTAVRKKRSFHAAELLLGDAYSKLNQAGEARAWYTKAMQDSRFRDYCKHQIEALDRPASSKP